VSGGQQADSTRHEATASSLAWLVAGDRKNPAVLMLHGATMDMTMFEPQVRALQNRFHVLSVDLPGHGQSADIEFSMQGCVDGVLDIVDREEIQSCHLVGQSMGGIVCQLLARQRPGLALSLTLIGSVPLTAPLYRLKGPAFWLVKQLIRIAPLSLNRRLVARSAGAMPQTRAYIETCLGRLDRWALTAIVGEIGRTLKSGPYPVPDSSVLIIYGTRDLIALGLNRLLARRWASALDVGTHRIAKASHNANMDQPDAVNGLILEHLEGRTKTAT
jgi:pimeloyl-ACP methyl ester carboxylesterase